MVIFSQHGTKSRAASIRHFGPHRWQLPANKGIAFSCTRIRRDPSKWIDHSGDRDREVKFEFSRIARARALGAPKKGARAIPRARIPC